MMTPRSASWRKSPSLSLPSGSIRWIAFALTLAASLGLARAQSSIETVSAYGCPGQPICVCGSSSDGWTGLRIGGQPAGNPIATSDEGVLIRIPESAQPGTATVSIGGSSATIDIVDVKAELKKSTLRVGESTQITASPPGSPRLRYRSSSSQIQLDESTGQISGRSPGSFSVAYSVEPAACPCNIPGATPDDLDTLEDDSSVPLPLFVPGQVLVVLDVGASDPQDVAMQIGQSFGLNPTAIESVGSFGYVIAVLEGPPESTDVLSIVRSMDKDSRIEVAQPNYLYRTQSTAGASMASSYPSKLIRLDRLGDQTRGRGVRIGLIDSGVDADHPALSSAVLETISVSGRPYSADRHGTFVAGIIAARPVDGVEGVAPGAFLIAIKACNPQHEDSELALCSSLSVVKGIDEAMRNGVDVLNMSIGLPPEARYAKLVRDAVNTAADSGIFVVTAAGNDGLNDQPSIPAALRKAVAVTAVDEGPRLYWNASRGRFVDLAAPGVLILSTDAGGGTRRRLGGTSYAAAFVSGAAALLLEIDPTLSRRRLQRALEKTATDLGSRGRDTRFGAGLVDVCRAVGLVSRRSTVCE